MATYKQPKISSRYTSRASPELGSTPSLYVSNNLSHNSPLDELSIEQEWTSTRQSTNARVKARQQLYLHQEQQRAQEWSFVLEKLERQQHHHHAHLSPHVENESRDILDHDITSTVADDEDESGAESSILVNSSDKKSTTFLKLPSRSHAFTRTSSTFSPSIQSYSDLGSDGLEGLDELEDFSIWSQDEEDSTMNTPKTNSIPKSSSEQSISSSVTSFHSKTLRHPSFVYRNSDVVQSQMPFHDGSGNFFSSSNRNVLSQQGSDYESDVTSWDSSSSTCSKPKYQKSNVSKRSRRSRNKHQIYPSIEKSTTPAESESTIQNISLLQTHHASTSQTPSSHFDQPSYLTIPKSTTDHHHHRRHHRIRKSAGPSKLSKCSIYESEIEEMETMSSPVLSNQGWIDVFTNTLDAIQSHKTDLGVEDSTINNPIRALVQNFNGQDTDRDWHTSEIATATAVAASATCCPLIPTLKITLDTDASNESEINIRTNKVTTDTKKIKQQVSASSLEALQSLQMRHKVGYQETNSKRVPHVASFEDPMQIQFSPTIKDHSKLSRSHRRLDKSMSIATQTGMEHHPASYTSTIISALRSIRDHVKSNLMYMEYDEENSSSGLALECGLGTDWNSASRSLASMLTDNHGNDTQDGIQNDNRGNINTNRNSAKIFSASSPSLPSLNRSKARRTHSDCGLELFRSRRAESVF